MIHAFSTGSFHLTHHNSQFHMRNLKDQPSAPFQSGAFQVTPSQSQPVSVSGNMFLPAEGVILNAEDFYSALLLAAQRYLGELRQSAELQKTLRERVESERGGAIVIREIAL
jgi:hypothetical protein